MKQTLAILLLALAFVLPARAQLLSTDAPSGTQPLDRIVAVVNDDVVLQSELDQAVAQIQQQYASQPGQLPPLQTLKKQVLERLILMDVQVQKANEQGIHVSDSDVDQAVERVAQQNKISTDQLRQEIQRSGDSFDAFRDQLAKQITVQKLHQGVIRDSVTITDSEIDNLLNSPTYKAGEVHLAHIQISIPSGADAAAIKASLAKAEKALTAIHDGMDFNAAAIRYSDASNALDGGDLGWRRLDELPPAFAETIASMKNGDVSAALRGPTGFHIIKLIGQRKQQQKMVTELHARQILIKPSELLTPEQAHQKALDIYHRIVDKHEDFAKLAKKDSDDDTTANVGGDMGWFKPGDWGTAVDQQLAQLTDKQVSPPFQTDAGWNIVQRLGSRTADLTDQIARNQARQAIGNRKSEQAYEDFLRDARSAAYIKILVPELRQADAKAGDKPGTEAAK